MEGRVEVCYNGLWTTLTDNYYFLWNYNDARVVCHQLGFHDKCKYVKTIDIKLIINMLY